MFQRGGGSVSNFLLPGLCLHLLLCSLLGYQKDRNVDLHGDVTLLETKRHWGYVLSSLSSWNPACIEGTFQKIEEVRAMTWEILLKYRVSVFNQRIPHRSFHLSTYFKLANSTSHAETSFLKNYRCLSMLSALSYKNDVFVSVMTSPGFRGTRPLEGLRRYISPSRLNVLWTR